MRSNRAFRSSFLFLLLIATLLLSTSCFVRLNRVSYRHEKPVPSRHFSFTNDSLRFIVRVEPAHSNMVLPLLIFKGSKRKARLSYMLHGKGISAREYSIRVTNLVVRADTTVIARSQDPGSFTELIQRPPAVNAVTPLYGTGYKLKLRRPRAMNLTVHMEFEISSKGGLKEACSWDMPLERIRQKSFTLFNPF